MALEIRTREVKGITLLDLTGRVVLGPECASLRETIRQVLAEGKKKILVNFHNVSYIDSAGVGTLVASFTTARSAGGELKLLKLSPRPRETLQVTRLLTVFEAYDDEAEAVARFQ